MLTTRLSLRFPRYFSTVAPSQLINKNLWKTDGFINGEFTKGTATKHFDVYNPANGKLVATCPQMHVADVEAAVKVAYDSWQSWKMTTAKERGKIITKMGQLMTQYQEDLATILTIECGKPLAEARAEISYAQSFYEFYGEEAKRMSGEVLQHPVQGRRLLAIKQPVGPAALITPWNFPSAMITRKVGPALAAGCTVVIKPAEETPLSALALCVLAQEAGVPKGVINCLTVARNEVSDVGMRLCHHPLLRKISFTGSTAVGKWLMKESASTMKRISLELGGNAPFIVFNDADLEVAVNAFMLSKFRNAGQTCISSNRVYIQEGVYDTFTDLLAKRVTALNCGDGLDKNTTCGPLINSNGLVKVMRHVEDCVSKGAKAIVGGKIQNELNAAGGNFYCPTVLTNVTKEMQPFKEETFGPIAPCLKFKTEEEVITLANDTRMGLAGYICTKDLARAWRVSEALEFGMIGVNEGAISSEIAPFGGFKESGIGREGGHYGLDEYVQVKYICMGLGKQ